MDLDRDRHLVGAIFPDRPSAARAAAELLGSGIADHRLVTAVWADDRYVIESEAERRVGSGLVVGWLAGGAAGGLVGAILFAVVFPEFPLWAALLVGAIIGSGAGAVWGAYAGINRYQQQVWDEQDWTNIDIADREVLLVVEADEDGEGIRGILSRNGGRLADPARPT